MYWSASQKKIIQIKNTDINITEIIIIQVITSGQDVNSASYSYGFLLVLFRFEVLDSPNT
jgi:hypothetical protein